MTITILLAEDHPPDAFTDARDVCQRPLSLGDHFRFTDRGFLSDHAHAGLIPFFKMPAGNLVLPL